MQAYRYIVLTIILLLITLRVNSQTVKDTIIISRDSVKIENINSELRDYGKQGFLTDKLTIVQFGIVVVGAILSVPATPLLVISTGLGIVNAIINWKADKRLSEFNGKTKHKFKIHKKQKNHD